MSEIRIQLPTWLRVYTYFFAVLWFGMFISFVAFEALSDSPSALGIAGPVAIMCIGGPLLVRQFRVGARSEHDTLTVRNMHATMEFDKSNIAEFRTSRWMFPKSRVVTVVPVDGDLFSIDATAQAFGFGRDRQERQLEELRAWVATP